MIDRIGMVKAALLGAFAGALTLALLAGPASATLHGWCGTGASSTCVDNGVNAPTSQNPPNPFGFTGSSAGESGDLLLEILVPNNLASPSLFHITGAVTTTATLFSSTPWTSGQLDTYLGFSASPTNPIGAYLGPCPAATPCAQNLDPGATGFFVFQADVGNQVLAGASGPPTQFFNITESLPLASFIVAFLNQGGTLGIQATANSGAIFETSGSQLPRPTPEPGSLVLLGMGLLGVAGFRWHRRRAAK